ncbi:MAG TPA: helix-turn-helix domain-containing protein [bacterium]|nr:helix-turn-helix domain-containing protein [bacterium]HOM26372.1 helix-turn-helix domain-containing protein [bacterium]
MAEKILKRLLNIKEANQYLGISSKTLYKWVNEKRIPYVKVGGKFLRFDIEKLNKWIEQHTVEELKILKNLEI